MPSNHAVCSNGLADGPPLAIFCQNKCLQQNYYRKSLICWQSPSIQNLWRVRGLKAFPQDFSEPNLVRVLYFLDHMIHIQRMVRDVEIPKNMEKFYFVETWDSQASSLHPAQEWKANKYFLHFLRHHASLPGLQIPKKKVQKLKPMRVDVLELKLKPYGDSNNINRSEWN